MRGIYLCPQLICVVLILILHAMGCCKWGKYLIAISFPILATLVIFCHGTNNSSSSRTTTMMIQTTTTKMTAKIATKTTVGTLKPVARKRQHAVEWTLTQIFLGTSGNNLTSAGHWTWHKSKAQGWTGNGIASASSSEESQKDKGKKNQKPQVGNKKTGSKRLPNSLANALKVVIPSRDGKKNASVLVTTTSAHQQPIKPTTTPKPSPPMSSQATTAVFLSSSPSSTTAHNTNDAKKTIKKFTTKLPLSAAAISFLSSFRLQFLLTRRRVVPSAAGNRRNSNIATATTTPASVGTTASLTPPKMPQLYLGNVTKTFPKPTMLAGPGGVRQQIMHDPNRGPSPRTFVYPVVPQPPGLLPKQPGQQELHPRPVPLISSVSTRTTMPMPSTSIVVGSSRRGGCVERRSEVDGETAAEGKKKLADDKIVQAAQQPHLIGPNKDCATGNNNRQQLNAAGRNRWPLPVPRSDSSVANNNNNNGNHRNCCQPVARSPNNGQQCCRPRCFDCPNLVVEEEPQPLAAVEQTNTSTMASNFSSSISSLGPVPILEASDAHVQNDFILTDERKPIALPMVVPTSAADEEPTKEHRAMGLS